MANDMTNCRDYGHNWRPYDVQRVTRDRKRFFLRTLACSECGTLRSHVVDSQGFIVSGSNHYGYAAGYLVKGGYSADAKAQARLRHIESMLFDQIASREQARAEAPASQ